LGSTIRPSPRGFRRGEKSAACISYGLAFSDELIAGVNFVYDSQSFSSFLNASPYQDSSQAKGCSSALD
jgi:hypothetical protein